MYFTQIDKSVQGHQEWTTKFLSNFVSYWYAYLKTSKTEVTLKLRSAYDFIVIVSTNI